MRQENRRIREPPPGMRYGFVASHIVALSLAAVLLSGCAVPSNNELAAVDFSPPTDDGSTCHAPMRVELYQAMSAAAETTRHRQHFQQFGGVAQQAGRLAQYLPQSTYRGQISSTLNLASRLADISARASNDGILIADVTVKFDRLVRCRRQEAIQLQSEFRARRISRNEALERMSSIRSSVVADAEKARLVNRAFSARNEQYLDDVNVVEVEATRETNPAERRTRQREAQEARTVVQTNQRALQEQRATVDRALSEGWTISSISRPPEATLANLHCRPALLVRGQARCGEAGV